MRTQCFLTGHTGDLLCCLKTIVRQCVLMVKSKRLKGKTYKQTNTKFMGQD